MVKNGHFGDWPLKICKAAVRLMAILKAEGGFLPPLRIWQAVAVVLTAAMGLALVAALLKDVQAGAGGVAVLESSGERIARLEVRGLLLCCGARLSLVAVQRTARILFVPWHLPPKFDFGS